MDTEKLAGASRDEAELQAEELLRTLATSAQSASSAKPVARWTPSSIGQGALGAFDTAAKLQRLPSESKGSWAKEEDEVPPSV
jgi:hypothetical protein